MSERLQAAETLRRIKEEKIFFNALKTDETSAFINMLVLTVLRHLTGLEEILCRYLKSKIKNKDIILKYLLLCGSAEILYLNTPDYAAVNEYVRLAKKTSGQYAGGMLNAVLRRIAAEKPKSDKVFPTTFKKILEKDYTPSEIQKMEVAALSEPPLDLSVKKNPALWAEKLGGILLESGTVRLQNLKTKITDLEGYAKGAWWVQDAASALPVKLLGDVKGLKTLDLCAAPGGKTAELLSAGALVTAVDLNPERMERLRQNIKRLGLEKNLKTFVSDGLDFLQNTTERFDIIVLDAPCSATGTFRRHPEVMHFKTLADVQAQAKIQESLLNAAATHLNKNGRLLYATCSLAKDEGERQIEKFLSQNPSFQLCPFAKTFSTLEKNIFDNQVLRTLPYNMPDLGGMDGFFAACLQQK